MKIGCVDMGNKGSAAWLKLFQREMNCIFVELANLFSARDELYFGYFR